MNIADWKDRPSAEGRNLLMAEAGMNINPFNFGTPHTRTTFNSYILQLPDASYDIFRPWQWNHLCFAWSLGGKSKIVLVMSTYKTLIETFKEKRAPNPFPKASRRPFPRSR